MKFLVVISTGGAVINELLKYPIVKEIELVFIMDRQCKAIDVAEKNNVKYFVFEEKNNVTFSDLVLDFAIKNKIDYIYSFYLKLFKGNLLDVYKFKIINFHPSILPAFCGFNPIEKAINYGAKIIGTTVHFIDNTIDEGLPILQSLTPVNLNSTNAELTHKLFVHQCKSILQLTRWIIDNRLIIENDKCYILNASFGTSDFYPNIDYEDAIHFTKQFN